MAIGSDFSSFNIEYTTNISNLDAALVESLLYIMRHLCYYKVRYLGRYINMKNRLEELRKGRDMLQEDLADALGVSRQTVGSLENGRYNPSILLAFKISRFFKLTIEEIFIYEED